MLQEEIDEVDLLQLLPRAFSLCSLGKGGSYVLGEFRGRKGAGTLFWFPLRKSLFLGCHLEILPLWGNLGFW